MSDPHTSHTPVNLGAAKEIARRLVERGRFESIIAGRSLRTRSMLATRLHFRRG